jgi:5S rRNA maturation endonuclease (ribonuclease M5)
LIRVLKGLSVNDSISLLQPFVREKAEIVSSIDPMSGLYPYEPGGLEYEWRGEEFEPKPIIYGSSAFSYLVNRGIGRKDIEYFKIQDWAEAGRIIVPIHRKRKLISWIGRTYQGGTPKVWAPVGAPKRWEIFGLDLVTNWREANISEGWADAIRLHQSGLANPLALCGSRMSEQQAEEISRFEKIRVWMDGDLAGRGLALDIATWLPGKEIEVVQCPDNQDPGSLDVGEIQKLQPKSYREWRNLK